MLSTILIGLGAAGGILYLVFFIVELFMKIKKKWDKYADFYNKYHEVVEDRDFKIPMGFKTKKEEQEIEDRISAKRKA